MWRRCEEEGGSPLDGRVKGAGEGMLFSKHASIISLSHTHTRGGEPYSRWESSRGVWDPAAAVSQSTSVHPLQMCLLSRRKPFTTE